MVKEPRRARVAELVGVVSLLAMMAAAVVFEPGF